MDNAVISKLYGEKNNITSGKIMEFLQSCEPPKVLLLDHGKAVYYYRLYETRKLEMGLPDVSKEYFLYLWFCHKGDRSSNVNMRNYNFFSGENVDVSKVSYRDFTQAYADEVTYHYKLNAHYTAQFLTIIHYRYPLSLRSLLDRMILEDASDYITLSEGSLITIKSIPTIMADPETVVEGKKIPKSSLFGSYKSTSIYSDYKMCIIESDQNSDHMRYVRTMAMLTDSTGREENTKLLHRYEFPSREFNYFQIVEWARRSGISHSVNESQMSITLENFVSGSRCEVQCKKLEYSKCYYNGDYETYRLKGDYILELTINSDVSREMMYNKILAMYHELDKSITQQYPDPMLLGASDCISLLRAVDSITFDSEYCRKAPPHVQPLVIRESDIVAELNKGKMILRYNGNYYTTKDRSVSRGEDYIGMINKFGDYDPSKAYNPVIRTYRKNHLLSKKFKEFKAYLLRHSIDVHSGYISRDDVLLPKNLEYLYTTPIINPPLQIVDIHTKKTIITNINKVATGEVPDYVKSLLGSKDVRRYIAARPGTGLLHCCNVEPKAFAEYVRNNLDLYYDTISIDSKVAERDILAGNVDHRIYGKLLETYTDRSLLVFCNDGLIPYRYSKLESREYYILYQDGKSYDVVYAIPESGESLKLATVKEMVNAQQPSNFKQPVTHKTRDIDYTLAILKLVSYAATVSEALGYRVTYSIVSEDECESLAERVYGSCCYYESLVPNANSKYMKELMLARRSNSIIVKSIKWLQYIYGSMIHVTDDSVDIRSPVDMSKYHKWNLSLEDCLYYSAECYKVRMNEEVQRISQ